MKNRKSVSKILNLYFDEVNINLPIIQEGIFRGNGLDLAIENFYKNKEDIVPTIDILIKKSNQAIKLNYDDLYQQSKQCIDGFKKFFRENEVIIDECQKYLNNQKINVHGYIDALITLNKKKYVIDWKSKRIFKPYLLENNEIIDKYNKSLKFNKQYIQSFNNYKINIIQKYKEYSWSHLRYCLQVCFYWLMLEEPDNFECLIGYFDTKKNYFLYTFNKHKAKKICIDMIKYAESSLKQQNQIKEKLKKIDWMKLLEWKEIKI